MRCASPPERESAERPRVRYSRPTLLRKRRRSFTSLRIGRAISGSRPPAVRPFPRSGMLSKNCSASVTGRSTTSPMLLPWSSTDRLSGRSRLPPHVGHACSRSEEHTSELQSHSDLVCRLLLEKKNRIPRKQVVETRERQYERDGHARNRYPERQKPTDAPA